MRSTGRSQYHDVVGRLELVGRERGWVGHREFVPGPDLRIPHERRDDPGPAAGRAPR